jgi:predicted phosphodiesterase
MNTKLSLHKRVYLALLSTLFLSFNVFSVSQEAKKINETIRAKDIPALTSLLSEDTYKKVVNEKNVIQNAPLHEAAALSKKDPLMTPMVELLLQNGADPFIKNMNGQKASALATPDSEAQKLLKSTEKTIIDKRMIEANDYNWDTLTLQDFARDIFAHQPEFGIKAQSKDFDALVRDKEIQATIAKTALINLFDRFNQEIKEVSIQKIVCSPTSKIAVIGDSHGSLHTILRSLLKLKKMGLIDNTFKLGANNYLVFLGDYSDRGHYGIEIWALIMLLKLKNPTHVILIKGNHDDPGLASQWEFDNEIRAKYGKEDGDIIIGQRNSAFNKLVPAAFVGTNNHYIFMCHGWLPYYTDQTKKDELKTTISECIVGQEKACLSLSSMEGILNGRFLLQGEVPRDHDPRIKIADFTQDYLKEISSPESTIVALFCGHKHYLAPTSTASSDFTKWVALTTTTPLETQAVYVFTSAPEIGDQQPTEGGFGLVTLSAEAKDWTIAPYLDKTTIKRTDKKFVHVTSAGTFEYKDEPQTKEDLKKALQ